jgi:hypothetical protein
MPTSQRLGLGRAGRLGQLMRYVATDPARVDTAEASASLQPAIWNILYDKDNNLLAGPFQELSNCTFDDHAGLLLSHSINAANRYQVFTLEKRGDQNSLLLRNQVPAPTSLALPWQRWAGSASQRAAGRLRANARVTIAPRVRS